jgi:glycerol-3-phosphate dehydrogenase subunit C
MARIESKPTDALSYNPNEPRYWDREKLNVELNRVFDICHGCRLCFNLCPAFPALFEAIDRVGTEDVRDLKDEQKQRVIDLCYECKLCEVRCPYTPRDGHEFQVDFPRLIMRARAVNGRQRGIPLRDRILGDPDRVGKLGTAMPRLANFACRGSLQRLLMEKLLGIHRQKIMPDFARERFTRWIERHGLPPAPAEPAMKVAIFHTCFVNYYNPAPGMALVEVLHRNACQMVSPPQNCCGMPAIDAGDIAFAQKQARQNIDTLLPFVRSGYRVAAINPTCSMALRREYPNLVDTPEAREIARAAADPHELLDELRRQGRFNRAFRSSPGKVAYHVPCHLKAQNIGLRSRQLLRQIPGIEVITVDACTAHDGIWAMKKENFELSMNYGERAFAPMREAHAAVMATDCPLAAIQIEQGTGTRPLNPVEILARAYEPDGFPNPVNASTAPRAADQG